MNIHIYYYFMGWVYYTVIPICLIYLGVFPLYTDRLSISAEYIYVSVSMLLSFLFGSHFGSHVKISGQRIHNQYVHRPMLAGFILIGSLFYLFYFLQYFKLGYDGTEHVGLGALSTSLLVIVFLYLNLTFRKKSLLRYVTAMLVICITGGIVLSGARLYVLTVIFWLAAHLLYTQKINRAVIFLMFIACILFTAYLGVWRMGLSIQDVDFVFYIVAEPLLVYFSTLDYFIHNEVEMFNINRDFLNGFVNLIPSIILPNKNEIYSTLTSQGLVRSPYGGLNLSVSMIGNFGFIGSIVVSFFMGFLMKRLSVQAATNNLWRNYYYFLSSFSIFILHREPFGTQLKLLLVISIVAVIHLSWSKRVNAKIYR